MRIHKADPRNWDIARWSEVVADVLLGGAVWIITHDPLKGLVFGCGVIILTVLRDIMLDIVRGRRRQKQ